MNVSKGLEGIGTLTCGSSLDSRMASLSLKVAATPGLSVRRTVVNSFSCMWTTIVSRRHRLKSLSYMNNNTLRHGLNCFPA